MRFATLADGNRDGRLILVSPDRKTYALAEGAQSLQQLLDDWAGRFPQIQKQDQQLQDTGWQASHGAGLIFDNKIVKSPLTRAYEWIDGSAYINHVMLVRKARKAEPPATLKTDPLVYQGGSGVLLSPCEPIVVANEAWGADFESEVCVVLGDTPQGTTADQAHKYIRLVMLANDVSLRNLIPEELAKGFGFFCSKPATAFSPIALTPDELGTAWRDGRLHLPLCTKLNGKFFGNPDAGPEMHFSFYQLIEHICRTRSYTAGTILGSGTVSNEDQSKGSSCLAEKRMIETIATGSATTPFLKNGDKVEIEMIDANGVNLFGTISQTVKID